MELKTKDNEIIDEGIDVYLELPNTRARIIFDHNTPEIVEKGLRRWIKKELNL